MILMAAALASGCVMTPPVEPPLPTTLIAKLSFGKPAPWLTTNSRATVGKAVKMYDLTHDPADAYAVCQSITWLVDSARIDGDTATLIQARNVYRAVAYSCDRKLGFSPDL